MTFKRDDTFSYRRAKSGDISISFLGKQATMLRGNAAEKFMARVYGAKPGQAQQIMACATGNFKRSNERSGSGK